MPCFDCRKVPKEQKTGNRTLADISRKGKKSVILGKFEIEMILHICHVNKEKSERSKNSFSDREIF